MRTSLAAATLAILAVALEISHPAAQEPPLPAFEVASVRPNRSGDRDQFVRRQPGGNFDARNMPLRALIVFAYQLQGFQLVGAPDWIATERFDITAKAASNIPPTPIGGTAPEMLMLRSLLADRFKLVVHRETRELPIYALVALKPDGPSGPQLRQSQTDCQALMKAAAAAGGAPPRAPGDRVMCGIRVGLGVVSAGSVPMSEFARVLAGQVQRVVLDRTGLTGLWDVDLKFTPEQLPLGPAAGPDAPSFDPNGPSLFTAVQEQLGLKLESTKGPVEVLVVDRIERPTED